ncbi:hypothetical protein A1507_11980 [Methylomonas koyamae]|uniref:Uncharacterized protein n=1 Tax=Methylomonas koyamae TaxID=702114 RepID=A0A177NGF0_9GAMM|nr:conjugative transfer protein MobI(A/C) [Methylomonas koyamae]OAI16269.1 hypothetical protein A1507_11980 [Methylomonas koyamae]
MAATESCNLTERDEDHRYKLPPEVCAWTFEQLNQLRAQADIIVEQYEKEYCGLVRTISGVDRYPLGIKLDAMKNNKFAVTWGTGKWQGNKFSQTKKFSLQSKRFRIYYIDDYLVNAPIELKNLAYETENKIERIRKLQHNLFKIIEHVVRYESAISQGSCGVNHSTLQERSKQHTNQNIQLSDCNSHSSIKISQWIKDQRELLYQEAEYYVSYYWSNNRKNATLEDTSISLGLRIKNNRGNSISIEWFEAKFVGRKVFEKKRFKKPRNIHTYSILEKLLLSEPEWFVKLVMDTEEELVRIRTMICILSGIKETILTYQNIDCS